MSTTETLFAASIVTLTCGTSFLFGCWYVRTLRRSASAQATDVDRGLLRRSAIRRLIVSIFLCLAGGLIAATYMTGLAAEIDQIAAKRENERIPLDAQERQAVSWFIGAWIAALTCVGISVVLIGVDMYYVRKHWSRRLARLRDDRRAMMERQLSRLRAERGYTNGYHVGDSE